MNFRERPLTRRQLLSGGATLAVGLAAGTWQVSRYRDTHSLAKDEPIQPSSPKPLAKPEKQFIESQEEKTPYHLRYTEEHEVEYAHYIHSLGLTYIAPFELLRAHRNCCRGVQNTLPPEPLWEEMAPTLKVADELRARLGRKMLLITSAYRSPSYNRVIPGSAARSYHTKNCALDLVYDCPAEVAFREAKKMRAEGIFKGGMGLYSSFIHLDTRGSNAVWSRA